MLSLNMGKADIPVSYDFTVTKTGVLLKLFNLVTKASAQKAMHERVIHGAHGLCMKKNLRSH